MLSYISSSLHAAFTPAMFPERFTLGGDPEPLRAAAIERVGVALRLLETRLGAEDFLLGRFSVCDLYLLVFLFWRGNPAVQGKLPATPGLDALQQRLLGSSGGRRRRWRGHGRTPARIEHDGLRPNRLKLNRAPDSKV